VSRQKPQNGFLFETSVDILSDTNGIRLDHLSSGDIVTVFCADITCTFEILESQNKQVIAKSDHPQYLSEETFVRIAGAKLTIDGTTIRNDWILFGFGIELIVGSSEEVSGSLDTVATPILWLSPVKGIELNGVAIGNFNLPH